MIPSLLAEGFLLKVKTCLFGGVLTFAYVAVASGVTNPQINRLLQEKQQKMAQLEQCAKKVNGFKIAGISTLGLTAAGVAGNVVLSGKNKALKSGNDSLETKIKEEQEKIEDLDKKITAEKNKINGKGNSNIENKPANQGVDVSSNGKNFVLVCNEAGRCKFKGQNIPTHTSCNTDFKLTPGNPVFVHFDEDETCYKKLGEMQKQPGLCDFESYIFTTELDAQEKATPKGRQEGGYLFFCRSDGEIIREYERNKSYDEKKCTSSFGKWENNQCNCHDSLRKINGECLCPTSSKFKYPIKTPWVLSNYGSCDHGWLAKDEIISHACTDTGGRILSDGTCACPSTMTLDKSKNWCNCNSGLKYVDPSRKSEGCE